MLLLSSHGCTINLNEVKIFLAKTLVYENVNEYTLTLQVRNSPDLVAEAQLIIKVKDVNNLVSNLQLKQLSEILSIKISRAG